MFARRAGLRSGGPPPPPGDAAAPKKKGADAKAAPAAATVAASHRGVATVPVAAAKPAAAATPPPEPASEAECYERAMRPMLIDEAPLEATHAFKAAVRHAHRMSRPTAPPHWHQLARCTPRSHRAAGRRC